MQNYTEGQLASYKGRNYRVLWAGGTRFGEKVRLEFLNGSKAFYADAALVGDPVAATSATAAPSGPRLAIFKGRPKTVEGRKIELGTSGVRFWRGEDRWKDDGYRVGILLDSGEKVYTSESNTRPAVDVEVAFVTTSAYDAAAFEAPQSPVAASTDRPGTLAPLPARPTQPSPSGASRRAAQPATPAPKPTLAAIFAGVVLSTRAKEVE